MQLGDLWVLSNKIQGHPTQTVFFETALKDRNMQVRFDLISVLEC